MQRFVKEMAELGNTSYLKRSLEEAEIMKSGMNLVLMNPCLDTQHRDKYEKALSMLNSKIREIRQKI